MWIWYETALKIHRNVLVPSCKMVILLLCVGRSTTKTMSYINVLKKLKNCDFNLSMGQSLKLLLSYSQSVLM